MTSRRNVLIGIGGLVAGGGALLGTGAFTTVEAERTVTVETAGDADAFLSFTPAREDGAFVDDGGDTIEITLDDIAEADGAGINQNARSRFENLVDVGNNGTQDVDSLTFTVSVDGSGDDAGHEEAFKIVSGDTTIDADGEDLLEEADLSLDSGEDISFGVEIDLLIEDGIDDIDDDAEFTLTIEAQASE